MKSTLDIKLIIDKDNNNLYLSVKGDVQNSNEKEKVDLVKKLTEGFSYILGLDTQVTENEIVTDFEKTIVLDEDVLIPEEVEIDLGLETEKDLAIAFESQLKKAEEEFEQTIFDTNDIPQEVLEQEDEKLFNLKMKFGKYSGKTPNEVYEESKADGLKLIQNMIPSLLKNAGTYPANLKIVNDILSLSFSNLVLDLNENVKKGIIEYLGKEKLDEVKGLANWTDLTDPKEIIDIFLKVNKNLK